MGPNCGASAQSSELVKGEGRGLQLRVRDQGGDLWLCPDTLTEPERMGYVHSLKPVVGKGEYGGV